LPQSHSSCTYPPSLRVTRPIVDLYRFMRHLLEHLPEQNLNMLSLSIPVIGLFVLLFLGIFKFIINPIFFSPLSKVPNAHWTSPFAPAWILWIRFYSKENRTLHAAHLKYGPVLRVAPNELSVNDISSVRTVYTGGFEKGQWYSIFDNYGYVLNT